ncbi:hypothetical protein SAMN02799630_00752 [Paenibacillus sp. UNCCL117]|uniref:hypothetical protein n=1 Tax=unclassified Paenibacillus TaxID=185978 RepID=UPI00088521F3|nr:MULTISPECIES: hypothetical protein [unclassified Paenibacillus]SDC18835.1 hypothetical protein SAMN04488602_101551 [Paenibacillus sp. cl123]SFW18281.1 hypothetical protein SAMN02799630_00752 [Paenibacillus sp. UNCCL117]
MNEAKAAAWSRTRQMGKAKFVMIRGVLLYSLSLTAVFTAIEWFSQQTLLSSWLTVRLLVFGIVGFFAANFQWDGNERGYAAYEQGKQSGRGGKKPAGKDGRK